MALWIAGVIPALGIVMQQPTSNSNPRSSEPLSDATIRRIMEETAAEIESPDSGLYNIIEKRIKASANPKDERTAGRFCWTAVISTLRTFCLQPRFAWGLAAVQAAIIVIFIISPQSGLHTPGNSYKTLSLETTSSSAENLYLAIFHDSASMTSIEKLLLQTHTTITDGPGKDGIFILKVSGGSQPAQKEALNSLRNSPLVAFFEKQIN